MSLFVDLHINGQRIAGMTITRHSTDSEGIHTYNAYYVGKDASGEDRACRVRLLHRESDGATVLASKALGEVQRKLQTGVWR